MTKSYGILRTLVAKGVLGGDMLQTEAQNLRHANENVGEYHYLAAKLRDIYDEVENPTPRGHLEEWFERRAAQRYFMMATLGGLLAAIILGLLSLGVSIFQAWVGYQQWQHPIST